MSYGSNDPFQELDKAAAQQYGGAGAKEQPDFLPPPQYIPTDGREAPAGADGTPAAANAQPPEQEAKATSRFWRTEFYQQFFDVNTRQVLLRLSNVLVPLNPPDFLLDRNWHLNAEISPAGAEDPALEEAGVRLSRSPDLYGPFWVCTTLWMLVGIVSNIMSRISFGRSGSTGTWKYDFSVASVACIVMYLYCFVFGAIVWGIMRWKGLPATLTDTVCLYGYSMFIFVLVAFLCVIPVNWLQWIVVLVGGLWSTAYLLINFWHMWKSALERKWFLGIVGLVAGFHILLTLSFKFYFFKYKI